MAGPGGDSRLVKFERVLSSETYARTSEQTDVFDPTKIMSTMCAAGIEEKEGQAIVDMEKEKESMIQKNSREKWRKWISLTGSPCWPSASANHRQTG